MKKIAIAGLICSSLFTAAGCASVDKNVVQSASANEAGTSLPAQVEIPVLSVPDTGVRLNFNSGLGASETIDGMVRPLLENERKYLARAIFFVASYENCIATGNLSARRGAEVNKAKNRNLTPEQCYDKRGKIHTAAGNRRWLYGSHGRPDDNKRANYRTLGGTVVDNGWTDTESWNRYAAFVGTAANGMTRTDVLTKYHTIMGKRSEKILSNSINKADDFLSSPLGSILKGTL